MYKQGIIAGLWVVICYTLLISDLCRNFGGLIILILFFVTSIICGIILSFSAKSNLNKNMFITCIMALLSWIILVVSPLGGILNYGFGNVGGYLPGNILYFIFGIALMLVLLLAYPVAILNQNIRDKKF